MAKETFNNNNSNNNNNNNNNNKKNRRRGRKDGKEGGGGNDKKNVSVNNNNNTNNTNNTLKDDMIITNANEYKGHSTILIHPFDEENPTWYDYGKNLPGRNDTIFTHPPTFNNNNNNKKGTTSTTSTTTILNHNPNTPNIVAKYRSLGDLIYQKELALFSKSNSNKNNNGNNNSSSSSRDERWVETTMKKGTLKDRIAAMSVTISTDPIHKFYTLDGLLSMVGCTSTSTSNNHHNDGGKPNSRVAQLTAEALEDLFLNTLLPSNRKLISLAQRPLYRYETTTTTNHNNNKNNKNNKNKNNNNTTTTTKNTLSPRILLLWRFEEMIKEKYELYLRNYMAQTLQDATSVSELQKLMTLKSASNMLCSTPEGESQLLAMIVNKLGDPNKKVAAAAGHQLRCVVLQQHPNMQIVIAREVQQLAHRPHLSSKALYNCIIFLNQLKLEKETETTDNNNNNNDDVNNNNNFSKYNLPASLVKTYFRLFEVAVKKNDKKSSNNRKKDEESEEEAGMKSRLLSALLTGVNRAHPYLPEKDKDMEQYIDSLYRVVHTAAPAACTQALMLLFHLAVGSSTSNDDDDDGDNNNNNKDMMDTSSSSQPPSDVKIARQNRFYRALYATLSKPTMISTSHGGKHLTMYFNLLYKAMKFDTNSNRVNAFAKRLICTVLHSNAPSLAGCLFLLNEISKTHDGLRSSMEDIPSDIFTASLILDETKREPSAALVVSESAMSKTTTNTSTTMEGTSSNNNEDKADTENQDTRPKNPPFWELSMISHHYHPSVAKFSDTMGMIEYAGDPLKDFALIPFLDKFAYKNPKSKDNVFQRNKKNAAGNSIARRRWSTDTKMIQSRLELPVNDPSYFDEKPDGTINEQEEFFHKFFQERARRDEIKGIQRGKSNNNTTTEEEEEAAEEEALDIAEEKEGLDDGGKSFEEYERAWETDSEEEAFADSLAEKLLDDAADGEIDLDDEDPDMDDWGDLYASEDEGNNNNNNDNDDNEKNDEKTKKKTPKQDRKKSKSNDDDDDEEEEEEDDDEIPGMAESDSDDDDDENSDKIMVAKDEDDFMDANDSDVDSTSSKDSNDGGNDDKEIDDDDDDDDDDEDEEEIDESAIEAGIIGNLQGDEDDDDDDDDDNAMGLLDDEDDDSNNNNDIDLEDTPTFVDAEEYEEIVNKGWNELKKNKRGSSLAVVSSTMDEKPKKKRKKNKKKNKA